VSGVVKESCISATVLCIHSPLTLDKDGTVPKGRLGFTDCSLKVLLETSLVPDDSHTTSTTSHGGLDDDWEPVFLDKLVGQVVRSNGSFGTGDNRYTGLDGKSPGLGLVSESVNGFGSRTDECDSCVFDLFGEFSIFREETVSTSQPRFFGYTYPGWIISTLCSKATRTISS